MEEVKCGKESVEKAIAMERAERTKSGSSSSVSYEPTLSYVQTDATTPKIEVMNIRKSYT